MTIVLLYSRLFLQKKCFAKMPNFKWCKISPKHLCAICFLCSLTFNTRTHAQKIRVVSTSMETFERECCVRGYHVYKDTWEAVIGEEFECVREQSNDVDWYAVAVLKDDIIVGHLPKTSAVIYLLFLRRGNVIQCRVAAKKENVFRLTLRNNIFTG